MATIRMVMLIFILIGVPIYAGNYITHNLYTADQISRAVEGYSENSLVLLQNPAGLNALDKISLGTFHTTYMMGDSKFSNIGLSVPVNLIGTKYILGIAYSENAQFGFYESVFDANGTAYIISEYSILDKKLSGAIATVINDNIDLGFNFNYYSHKSFELIGSGLDMDAGIKINMPADLFTLKELQLSMVMKDFLPTQMRFSNYANLDLPISFLFSGKLNLTFFELFFQRKMLNYTLNSAGIKLLLIKEIINIQFGINEYLVNKNIKSVWSTGLNINFGGLGLSYAYQPNDYAKQSHYFSMNFNY